MSADFIKVKYTRTNTRNKKRPRVFLGLYYIFTLQQAAMPRKSL